jgi:hypothetical protein
MWKGITLQHLGKAFEKSKHFFKNQIGYNVEFD